MSKKLVTILIDVPVDASIADFERKEVDKTKLESIFKELEFTGLLKKIGGDADAPIKTTEHKKEYDLITTLKRLEEFAGSIKEGEWLSVDLETTSVNPMIAEIVGFSFSVKKDTGAYVPIHYKDKVENLFGDNDLQVAIDILKPVLENEKIPKTGTKY